MQPIELLASGKVRHLNPNSAQLFSDVRDHLLKVIDEVKLICELMNATLMANSALIQTQQNSDMREISAYVGIGAVPTMSGASPARISNTCPKLNGVTDISSFQVC